MADQHEHEGRDGPDTQSGVLDSLVLPMERAYLMTLTKINAGIASALRLSARLTKSTSPLFVSAGDGDDLFKAVKKPAPKKKPEPKAKEPKAPKNAPKSAAQTKADRKPTEAAAAGTRGASKWYLDKHGHVRYGVRPAPSGDRFTEALPDTEVINLYKKLEVIIGFDDTLDEFLASKINMPNFDGAMLKNLIDAAQHNGASVHDFVTGMLVEGGESEEDAEEAWGRFNNSVQAALEDPEMIKKAHAVVERRKSKERSLSKWLDETGDLTKDFHKNVASGDIDTAALRSLALLVENGTLFMPSYHEAKDKSEQGSLRTDDDVLDYQRRFFTDMNGGQLLTWAIGERLRQVINAGEDDAADVAFKDENGEWGTGLPADLDELIWPAMDKAFKRKLSDKEQDLIAQRVNEIGFSMQKQIEEMNNFEGGEAISMLLREEITSKELFHNEDVLKTVNARVQAKRELRTKAIAAREDSNFELSKSMKGKLTLMDYQKKMVNWMLTIKRGMLAADTGMGKTPMLISAVSKLIEEGKTKRGVLVLPKSLVKQWPDEIKAFFPDAEVVTLGEGMSMEDRLDMIEAINSGDMKADFVIMSASTLEFDAEVGEKVRTLEKEYQAKVKERTGGKKGKAAGSTADLDEEYGNQLAALRREDRMANALRELEGAVVFDEAHHSSQGLKNKGNRHHHIAAEMLRGREYGWLMTATPMPNGQPEEMFNLTNLIHPGAAGESLSRFTKKVATYAEEYDEATGKKVMKLTDHSDWTEMNKTLMPYVYAKKKSDPDVRRDQKAAGMTELQDANHRESVLAMDPELQEMYAQAGSFVPFDRKDDPEYKPFDQLAGPAKYMRVLDQQLKLATSPKLIFGPDWKGPQPKIEHVGDLVAKHFNDPANTDHPVVIFSAFPSSFKYMKEELAKKHGIDPSLIGEIHGGVAQSERDLVQDAANAGKIKIVLVGVQAGGAGLNLQKSANKIIFLDKPWAPADVDQAVGRVHRTGQKETVDVVHVRLNGAIDETKVKKLRAKIMSTEAALYANLGENYAGAAMMASALKLLGQTENDPSAGKTNEQLQSEIKALGLTGIPTAQVLKTQFNKEKFAETQDFLHWQKFGGQYLRQMRTVNKTRLQNHKIDKETYLKRERKIAREELAWNAVTQEAGATEVLTPKKGKGKGSTQPPAEFVALKGKNTFSPGTMEHEILDAMITKNVRTPEDLVETLLAPVIAKNAPDDHVETIKPKLLTLARKKFAELTRSGHLVPRTGRGADPKTEMPKGTGGDEPAAPKAKAAKPAAKPAAKEAPKKAPQKPAKAPAAAPKAGTITYKAKTHPKLKGDDLGLWKMFLKHKPKNFAEVVEKIAGGDKALGAELKPFMDKFKKMGLIE
jgi:SNF2 family DNA or RNA helicase